DELDGADRRERRDPRYDLRRRGLVEGEEPAGGPRRAVRAVGRGSELDPADVHALLAEDGAEHPDDAGHVLVERDQDRPARLEVDVQVVDADDPRDAAEDRAGDDVAPPDAALARARARARLDETLPRRGLGLRALEQADPAVAGDQRRIHEVRALVDRGAK